MLACIETKFRSHRAQGTQMRSRLRQGAIAMHQTQGIFLLMYCGPRSCTLFPPNPNSILSSIFSAPCRQPKVARITESTIITTIHCPDVGYCLFGISLVTYISYHVSCTFLIVIVSYWVVPSFARLFTPLAPCTQLGYSTLSTMY